MDYEKDVRIDETALDIEWLEQASLSIKYGKHYAFCKRGLTEVEEKIKIIKAGLIKKANSDPVRYCKKDKPNAADIEAYYRLHPNHIAAKKEWVIAQYELDIAEIAKNEIGFTRKGALENLVKLYLGSYFAGPSIPRDLEWEREAFKKRTNAGISAKLNKSSRRMS